LATSPCIFPSENNSDESKKKKGEDDGKSAASNGDTGQSTTPTSPAERGKGKLEKRKKGRDKSEKAEGKVIYDRVSDHKAQELIVLWNLSMSSHPWATNQWL
jgi:hypothetical protein